MGEIYDAHHAKDDRQPNADQRQAGDRVKNLDGDDERDVHVAVQILGMNILLVPGRATRSHWLSVFVGGTAGYLARISNFRAFA